MRFDDASLDYLRKDIEENNESNLANRTAMRAMIIHSFIAKSLKENETLDLFFSIGGIEYPLASIGPFFQERIYLESREEDGTSISFFTTIDQVSFMYIVSLKKADEPAREIGFHTTMERAKKT